MKARSLVALATVLIASVIFMSASVRADDYQNSALSCQQLEEEYFGYAYAHRESEFPKKYRAARDRCVKMRTNRATPSSGVTRKVAPSQSTSRVKKQRNISSLFFR